MDSKILLGILAVVVIGAFIGVASLQENPQQENIQAVSGDLLLLPPQPTQSQEMSCNPSYPTVCIPPDSPDLDCSDIQNTHFKVIQPDPHGLDSDNDGWGC